MLCTLLFNGIFWYGERKYVTYKNMCGLKIYPMTLEIRPTKSISLLGLSMTGRFSSIDGRHRQSSIDGRHCQSSTDY